MKLPSPHPKLEKTGKQNAPHASPHSTFVYQTNNTPNVDISMPSAHKGNASKVSSIVQLHMNLLSTTTFIIKPISKVFTLYIFG
jgi:hypothetical protein